MKREVWITSNEEKLSQAGAEIFLRCARDAVTERGLFLVMLSGGSTPKKMLQLLASPERFNQIPWDSTHFFWGDERMVPPDHPDSNFRMAWEALLQFAPIRGKQIHRVPTELGDAKAVAEMYEDEIRTFSPARRDPTADPRFDLIYLGMGENAHTASLFPGVPVSADRWVQGRWIPELGAERISVTPHVFNSGRRIAVLVSGEKKAHALEMVLEGPSDPERYPAQLIRPESGEAIWVVDERAASQLSSQFRQSIAGNPGAGARLG